MKNGDLKRFYPNDGKFDPKDFARLDKDGKISKDQIPDDVGTKVIANPTLAGTESDLTGLQVGDTKYKVPEGTVVVANPELAGTEDTLTGLQVGDTKYKVGGSLYLHCINVQARNTNASVFTYSPIHLNIYSPKESPYTYEEFKTWLKFNSYVYLNASGEVFYDENSTKHMVVTSIAPSTTTEGVFTAHGRFAIDTNNNLTVLSASAWSSQTMRSQSFSDNVIQII